MLSEANRVDPFLVSSPRLQASTQKAMCNVCERSDSNISKQRTWEQKGGPPLFLFSRVQMF